MEGRVVPQEFDVVCLGSGVAGEAIAVGLQDSGLTLAVVERELTGSLTLPTTTGRSWRVD
jgi:2-polyprenyl-6-methoxyphenol hydroxylase-like FAD-dependent oxidoreductase